MGTINISIDIPSTNELQDLEKQVDRALDFSEKIFDNQRKRIDRLEKELGEYKEKFALIQKLKVGKILYEFDKPSIISFGDDELNIPIINEGQDS